MTKSAHFLWIKVLTSWVLHELDHAQMAIVLLEIPSSPREPSTKTKKKRSQIIPGRRYSHPKGVWAKFRYFHAGGHGDGGGAGGLALAPPRRCMWRRRPPEPADRCLHRNIHSWRAFGSHFTHA